MSNPEVQQSGGSLSSDGVQLTSLAAYRGCWVALIGDQIAGVGVSDQAARLAARHSRPRERVTSVLFVAEDTES